MAEVGVALLGVLIGGVVGVASAYFTSYRGPLRLEQKRADIKEEHDYGPRKRLLKEMLADPDKPIRSFWRLKLVTGTTDEECKRLLIEIGARGVLMKGAGEAVEDREGWALIERYGLDQPPRVDQDAAESDDS